MPSATQAASGLVVGVAEPNAVPAPPGPNTSTAGSQTTGVGEVEAVAAGSGVLVGKVEAVAAGSGVLVGKVDGDAVELQAAMRSTAPNADTCPAINGSLVRSILNAHIPHPCAGASLTAAYATERRHQ
jgi:hypothetical protein